MVYVVLLAMVATFMALMLFRVLGKRTGHEQPIAKPAEDRPMPMPLSRPVDAMAEQREPNQKMIEGGAEIGLRAIAAAESGFDLTQFLGGARSAYKMILEAFWAGDEAQLEWLVGDDVRHAFGEAIAERTTAGHVLENRLVSIERALIVGAALNGREARISVRFDADISAVTRDADGRVVAGSLTDAVQVREIWTFARTMRSGDANWKLVETDEV